QAELLSVLLEVRTLNRLLVGEEQVVVLPELALLVCRHRGLPSEGSVLVEVERELRERDADVVRIGLEDLVDRRVDLGTEGALEVAELDDRDLGSLGALLGQTGNLEARAAGGYFWCRGAFHSACAGWGS